MKHFTGPLFFIIYCIFTLSSCKKDNKTEDVLYGRAYFPTNTGHELIYDALLITFSDFTKQWDTVSYQVKEIIAGSYLDNEGRETQRIERYQKTDSGNWVITNVWAANLLPGKAEREEENIRYVKLYFPVTLYQSWNGNAQNTLDREDYVYTAVNEESDVGPFHFDTTLTVLQHYFDDAISSKQNYVEKYAAGIGMIFKENTNIEYFFHSIDSVETTKAYIYTETLVSYKD